MNPSRLSVLILCVAALWSVSRNIKVIRLWAKIFRVLFFGSSFWVQISFRFVFFFFLYCTSKDIENEEWEVLALSTANILFLLLSILYLAAQSAYLFSYSCFQFCHINGLLLSDLISLRGLQRVDCRSWIHEGVRTGDKLGRRSETKRGRKDGRRKEGRRNQTYAFSSSPRLSSSHY